MDTHAIRRFLQQNIEHELPEFTQFTWIGAGGGGATGVWTKVDENNRKIDQVVVKDSYLRQHSWDSWWWRIADSGGPSGWIPSEADAMQFSRCDKVVSLISCVIYDTKKMYRLYMEYCPGGDLRALCKSFLPSPPGNLEPFVWWSLQCFTEAALAMLQGDVTTKAREWSYIHGDLKPHNIFLGCRDKNNFPAFPVLKTGDFGHAFKTSPTDERNPKDILRRGTHGWRSPEMELKHEQILSPSDVWVYGAICMSIMDLEHKIPGDLDFEDNMESEEELTPQFRDEAHIRSKYSKELVDLVLKCVSYSSWDRPNLSTMRETILRHTGGHLSAAEAAAISLQQRTSSGTAGAASNAQPDLAQGMRYKERKDAPPDMLVGEVHISFAEQAEAQTGAGHEGGRQKTQDGEQDAEMAEEAVEGGDGVGDEDEEMGGVTRRVQDTDPGRDRSRTALQGAQAEDEDDDSDYNPNEDEGESETDGDSDYDLDEDDGGDV